MCLRLSFLFSILFLLCFLNSCASSKPKVSTKPIVNKTQIIPPINPPISDKTSVISQETEVYQFERSQIVSSPILRQLDKEFDTLSVTEYKLKEHSLHKIEFNNSMLFSFDESQLKQVNIDDLKSFAKAYIEKQVGKNIYILGHTDSRGQQTYNQSLSVRRALVVAKVLVEEGISSALIKIVPAGETLPKTSNQTEFGRTENRRVEILTAESRELMKSYLRQIDCSQIDSSCTRAILPVLSIKEEKSHVLVENNNREIITTQTPELNDLEFLANGMNNNIELIDAHFDQKTERQRLNASNTDVRGILSLPTQIRNVFKVIEDIRAPLILSKKYYLQD